MDKQHGSLAAVGKGHPTLLQQLQLQAGQGRGQALLQLQAGQGRGQALLQLQAGQGRGQAQLQLHEVPAQCQLSQ